MDQVPNSTARSSATGTGFVERLRDPADQQAWVEFENRFSGRITAWCLSKGFSGEITNDVTRELVGSIRRKVQTYSREKGRFKRWLRRVAINTAIDRYRKKKAEEQKLAQLRVNGSRRVMSVSDGQELRSVVDDEMSRQILRDLLSGLLSRGEITRRNHDIFQQFLTARDHHEVVQSLCKKYGVSTAAVYMAKSRVKKQLMVCLEEFNERAGESAW
jgi:DNA-directed RNA polymerase specialized sigma24 family protein